MEDYNIVKNDFNEISQLDELTWNHNNCYFEHLIKLIPNNVETCPEIGCGNILDMKFENNSFDVIITTATAHHLPYDWLLCFAKNKLKKGGKLIILDLAKAKSLSDYIIWGSAIIPNIIMNLIKNGRLQKDDAHSKEVWERHGKHDRYMTINEIKSLAQEHIPTAKVRRKLFWRYLLVWQK